MKRIAAFFILLYIGFWCLQQSDHSRAAGWLPLATAPAGCGAILALDGSAHTVNSGTVTSLTVTLSTTNTPDNIIVIGNTGSGFSGVPTSAHLTFTQRNTAFFGSIVEWNAVSAGVLTSEVITVNQISGTYETLTAFGISGADTSTIFDGAAVTSGNAGAPADPLSITTAFANDFIIGGFSMQSQANPTQGAAFSLISGANLQLVENRIVSSIGVYSVPIGTGVTNSSGGMADAVKRAC